MKVPVERSAGVIVFRDDSPADSRLYLLLNYGRYWDCPKGHVEKCEDDLDAARRELREETGISEAEFVDGFREEMTYFFRDKRKGLIRKTAVFFLAHTKSETIQISHEHVGAEFLPYAQAIERLTYANAKKVLTAAEQFLTRAT